MKFLSHLPKKEELEDHQILKELISSHRHLAELKGLARSIPNDKILLSSLKLKEAKESSAIENIITTQESLYEHQVQPSDKNPADKEVHNYSKALDIGFKEVKAKGGLSLSAILKIQAVIEPKRSGLRKIPGTVIKNMATNKIVYTPPSPEKLPHLMSELENFINSNSIDPLIKMAVIHHQFESIHPFYDGNGRTGRILNILYLILEGLLETPILYLSKYIHSHRSEYYRHLQRVRDQDTWRDWIIYMLRGVSSISQETIILINKINTLFKEYKNIIRSNHKFYSHDLINSIFAYPYTAVNFLEKDIKISKATSARYLDDLTKSGVLKKHKLGKKSYYINSRLFDLLKDS